MCSPGNSEQVAAVLAQGRASGRRERRRRWGGLATAANSGVGIRPLLLPAAELGWDAEPAARSEGGCGPGGVCAAAAPRTLLR